VWRGVWRVILDRELGRPIGPACIARCILRACKRPPQLRGPRRNGCVLRKVCEGSPIGEPDARRQKFMCGAERYVGKSFTVKDLDLTGRTVPPIGGTWRPRGVPIGTGSPEGRSIDLPNLVTQPLLEGCASEAPDGGCPSVRGGGELPTYGAARRHTPRVCSSMAARAASTDA
jgi:hypothetical protein